MESVSVYRRKYVIGLSDVDFTGKLKQSALFGYFQDIASQAAENLGVGINVLTERFHVTWILARIKVEVIRNPGWNEEITIETWPQEPKKLEFERDFLVMDAQENVLIRGISTWVIIDLDTREVKRSELIDSNYPSIRTERAMECRLGRFRPSGQPEVSYKRMIGYSDVDLNTHLNNSRYVDFIMDCFPLESHRRYEVKSLEVNYMNEALPGEVLVLRKDISAMDNNVIYIDGVNEADERMVFRAQIDIRPRG